MDHPTDASEPPTGGRKRVRVTSIQQYESPDAAEDHFMADQRSAADQTTTEDDDQPRRDPARGSARVPAAAGGDVARGSAAVPGVWPPLLRPDPVRATARVRPAVPPGPGAARPAITDLQTTTGVPATPIPQAPPADATQDADAEDTQDAATGDAEEAQDAEALAQAEAVLAEAEAEAAAFAPAPAEAPDDSHAEVEVETPAVWEVDESGEVSAVTEDEPAVATVHAEPGDTTEADLEDDPADDQLAQDAEAEDSEVAEDDTAEDEPVDLAEAEDDDTAEDEPVDLAEAEDDDTAEDDPIDLAEAEDDETAEDEPVDLADVEDGDSDSTVQAEPETAEDAEPEAEVAEAEPEDAEPEAEVAEAKAEVAEPEAEQAAVLRGEGETQVIPRIPGEQTARIIPGEAETRRITVLPRPVDEPFAIPLAARLEEPPQPVFDRRISTRGGPYDLGHSPAVLMLSSLGVLLVALAYTGGREGTAGATVAYWIGQVVVFTPVVLRLLSRRMAGVAESFLLVMGLAVNQYLLKWMYSPDQFRFPDELQHWLATTTIMETGQLFQPNQALPPAVHFPGLAELGAAMASMTGLPVSGAGILVAGVAHLVFVGVLFVCVLRASNSPAVAGVACATYATALHYLFFSSMFLYQTAALPFFMLAIWATRRWREEGGWPFVITAVASIAMTTVSHHVTAFALIATLTLLGVTELFTEKPRRWDALTMPAVALGVVAAWILLVARDVIGYLEAPVDQVWTTVTMLMTDRTDASSVSAPVSIYQLALQGLGLIGLFVLFVAVGRDMVTRRDRDSWRWAALIGGLIFFAGNGVRFLGQNGPEIAGRLSTFTYVPISIIAAIALVRAVQILPSRDAAGRRWWVAPALAAPPPTGRNLVVRVLAGSALVTLLMIGARAGGWPPLGSLLPGPYLAGGFERSVDAYGVDAAEWERDTLGPGNRVGGDVTSVSLASTYGRQDPVREVGPLYYATTWGLAEDDLVESLHLDYLVVDRRLSVQLPQSDAYFENDPRAGRITEPLTATQIGKFDTLTDVDRLYDNGTVRIYRMGRDQ